MQAKTWGTRDINIAMPQEEKAPHPTFEKLQSKDMSGMLTKLADDVQGNGLTASKFFGAYTNFWRKIGKPKCYFGALQQLRKKSMNLYVYIFQTLPTGPSGWTVHPVWRILQTGSFLGKNGRKTGTFSAKKRAENGRNKNLSRKKTGALKFCFSFFLAVFTVLQVHPKTR